MRARWIFAGLLLALVATAIAFRMFVPASVELAEVTSGPAVEVVYATGFVEVEEPVEIAARVTAPITDILVDEGDRVVRGQVLARLDSADQQAQIAELAARTLAAALEAQRTLALHARGFATGAARDRVTTSLAAARAAEQAARDRLDNFVLRSGVNGAVLRRDAEPGDMASPTRTLFTIGDPARLKITATVDERDIPRIRVGQAALMSSDAYAGRIFRGRVREITLGGDPAQRAFRVRLEPAGNEPLPVGLTLEVNIVTREIKDAVLAPETAIVDGAVWRVENGKAVRVEVETGVAGPDNVEILRGLGVGDKVVVDPPETLKDGARVRAAGR
jgi:RND family efflux transporter MFP subunit